MPVHEDVVAAVDRWLQALPELDVYHKLDLAFIELRLGCWGFSQAYAMPEIREIQPLIARESFVAMLSLPADWRRSNRIGHALHRAVVARAPRAAVQRHGDYRDHARLIMRALRDPRLIQRKLREKFG